jgi:hypothetical protein
VSTPATRSLAQVLLTRLQPGAWVQLIIGVFEPGSTGAYAHVTVHGESLVVPKLNSVVPVAGAPAYLLAAPGFILCIGAVTA